MQHLLTILALVSAASCRVDHEGQPFWCCCGWLAKGAEDQCFFVTAFNCALRSNKMAMILDSARRIVQNKTEGAIMLAF